MPNASFASSLVGNGFAFSENGGYSGFNFNGKNNINVLTNVFIGYGGNKTANAYSTTLKNPNSFTSQFTSNLIGNLGDNSAQNVKDVYVELNSQKEKK